MVSLWPWKAADKSPASFEKELSALAANISTTQAKLDRNRSTSRRVRVLCTLYLAFGYLVYAIVLALVVGRRNMGAAEWTGAAGGPALIYIVRAVISAFYNFRIDSLTAKLKDLQTERTKTIQKLKDATKYDSTLQLLEKYGGAEPKAGKAKAGDGGEQKKSDAAGQAPHQPQQAPLRTRLPPPPTANIPRAQAPVSPQRAASSSHSPANAAHAASSGASDPSAEFAPNAYGSYDGASVAPSRVPGGQYVSGPVNPGGGALGGTNWYDRILDLLMGDDETAARNRIVLICSACRLVNGQAAPGTRSLADVGAWRCMGCHAMNGEVAEAEKIVSEVLSKSVPLPASDDEASGSDEDSDVAQLKEEDVSNRAGPAASGVDSGNARATRKRATRSSR